MAPAKKKTGEASAAPASAAQTTGTQKQQAVNITPSKKTKTKPFLKKIKKARIAKMALPRSAAKGETGVYSTQIGDIYVYTSTCTRNGTFGYVKPVADPHEVEKDAIEVAQQKFVDKWMELTTPGEFGVPIMLSNDSNFEAHGAIYLVNNGEENTKTFRHDKTKELAAFLNKELKKGIDGGWRYPTTFKGMGDFALAGTCLLDFFSAEDCMTILRLSVEGLDDVAQLTGDHLEPLYMWVFGKDFDEGLALAQKYWV